MNATWCAASDTVWSPDACVTAKVVASSAPRSVSVLITRAVPARAADRRGHALRWRNLWRYSDSLGGAVLTGPPQPVDPQTGPAPRPDFRRDVVDVRLVDPQWDRAGGDTQWPAAYGHSDFWADPLFADAVAALGQTLAPPLRSVRQEVDLAAGSV